MWINYILCLLHTEKQYLVVDFLLVLCYILSNKGGRMKERIEEGDVVVYVVQTHLEVGRVARIVREKDAYHIVPIDNNHYAKKRKSSELLSLKRINALVQNAKR